MHTIRNRKDRLLDAVNVFFMLLVVGITLFPFWYILVGSFNEGTDYLRGGVYLWPRVWTLANYEIIFSDPTIYRAFVVTLSRTVIVTVLHLLICSLFAFGLSRPGLRFKKAYSAFCLVTMFFSGGLIPYYLVLNKLGLIDSFLVYILPNLFSFYDVLIFMGFFRELPESLFESARIEGAGEYRIFTQIVLPLSKPVLASLALFTAVGQWNSYFDSLMYTNSDTLQTLMHYLMKMVKAQETSTQLAKQYAAMGMQYRKVTGMSVQLAAMIAISMPIIAMYPFVQKYFASGILMGSVKE